MIRGAQQREALTDLCTPYLAAPVLIHYAKLPVLGKLPQKYNFISIPKGPSFSCAVTYGCAEYEHGRYIASVMLIG